MNEEELFKAKSYADALGEFMHTLLKRQHGMDVTSFQGEKRILIYLSKHEKATAGELANFLHVGSARVANALKNLEEKGMIHRCQCKKDKRQIIITLTDKTKEKEKSAQAHFLEDVYTAVNAVGEETFLEFIETGKRFLTAFPLPPEHNECSKDKEVEP